MENLEKLIATQVPKVEKYGLGYSEACTSTNNEDKNNSKEKEK